MKEIVSFACAGLLVGTLFAAPEFARYRPDELLREPLGSLEFKGTFDSAAKDWKVENYKNRLTILLGTNTPCGADALYVGGATGRCDTAWKCVLSEPRKLTRRAKAYVFTVDMCSSMDVFRPATAGDGWTCSITWFGVDGKTIASEALSLKAFRSKEWKRIWRTGRIPDGAASYSFQIGYDNPDVLRDGFMAFRRPVLGLTDALWAVTDDDRPPRVKLLIPSPTVNAQATLKIAVTDPSSVRAKSVRIAVDGRDETAAFVQKGDVWTLTGAHTWTNGIHTVDVSATDWYGNARTSHKLFFIGDAPMTGKVEIRADGKIVADGTPFFPIGIYAVMKREFNGFDWDRAFVGLKKAGINTVHSYGGTGASAEFQEVAHRHGMKTWTAYKKGSWDEVVFPGDDFVTRLRHSPTTLAWYLADDTSGHQSPEELEDYDDAVKALDPNHPSAQADGLHPEKPVDNYRNYVNGTDIFIPEIYPIRAKSTDPDSNCVASVIRDMERCWANIAEFGDGRPRTVLPVLQYFKGWGDWPRMPNPDEETAMTFAAVVHGASGITWYTYGGTSGGNEGVTSTPERWGVTARMAMRLGELSPAILSPTVSVPEPKVLSGPDKDPLGQPSVTVLVKRHAGKLFAIAVNACYETVKARIPLPGEAGKADVLWEDRVLSVKDGLTDDFGPFAVHVYRLGAIPEKAAAPLALDGKGGFRPLDTRPHELNALFKAGHVQGVCCSERRIYLSHQYGIEVLDWTGRFVGRMDAPAHLGDTAYADGKIYGAFCLRGKEAGDKPGMIRVWDEHFNLLKERRFKENLDGITVVNGFVYTGVDTYGYPEHPEIRVKKLDLNLNDVADVTIPLGFKVNYGVQTMTSDGKNVYCGVYGATADKGNPDRYNFVELTPDLAFVRAARTGGFSEGFDRVPPSLTGGQKDVYLSVSALDGNMQGWRKDPANCPPRVRLYFLTSF